MLHPDARSVQAADISVVIPHYNDAENLDACLTLLGRQTLSANWFEIVVVDNNSPGDRSRLEAICAGRAMLVDEPEQGAAATRNAGVRAASGTVLAFIDSDCRPSPAWLSAGIAALKTAPLVGGRVEVAVADPNRLTPTEAFERVFAFNNERYIREERFSVTANLFTTRAVFDAVGGFRGGVSEDVEWGQRAAALGYAWDYAPEALVYHPARLHRADLLRKWRRMVRENYALHRERHGSRTRWLLRNWLVVLTIPVAAVQIIGSHRIAGPSDRFKALRTLCDLRVWRLIEAHRRAWS